jgi:hypothetical protein
MKRRLLILAVFAVLLAVEALWLLPDLQAAQSPERPPSPPPQPAAPVEQHLPITDSRDHARPEAAQPAAPDPVPAEWYAAQPAAPDAATPQRIPPSVLADSGDGAWSASLSSDGRYTTFESSADNLVVGDLDSASDVFVYDRQTGQTEMVSVDANGINVYGYFYDPSISDDGRYVAFYGYSDELTPNDTNSTEDVYVRDRQTGVVTRVSVKSNGAQANGYSYDPHISANGQFVVFVSYASNLVAGDTNNAYDVFVHNRTTGTTTRVSLKAASTQTNDSSWLPAVSADGNLVAFYSYATNLVTGDTNDSPDVFVRDIAAKTTTRVSVSSAGVQGNSWSEGPQISDNGRYVSFTSDADNLVTGDVNGNTDVFIRDRQTNTTTLVSRDAAGNQAEWAYGSSLSADGALVAFESPSGLLPGGATNSYDVYVRNWQTGTIVRASVSNSNAGGNGESWGPALSADGTAVAFHSVATNLVTGDNNLATDIFVRKMSANQTALASGDAFALTEPIGHALESTLSLDGRYVAFFSNAGNLVPGDHNRDYDVFVTDRQTGATTVVSTAYWGEFTQGVSPWVGLDITDNGRFVAFGGYGEYFIEDDENNEDDIFVRDRQTNTTTRVSVSSAGVETNDDSWEPSLSADGNLVAFISLADNLVTDDTNGTMDAFVHNRTTGVTTRLSITSNGAQADNATENVDIAAGGRFVVFSSLAALTSDDINSYEDIYVRDLQTGQIELITRGYDGSGSDWFSEFPVISSDGRYVAFESVASNLVADDYNGTTDIFLYDRQTDQMTLVSQVDAGGAGNMSWRPSISNDGRYVGFKSAATNLVPGDTNWQDDIFVFDRVSGTIGRASVNGAGQEANSVSDAPAVSGDGSKVAFTSYADNLVANDTYGFADVFITDRPSGSIPPDPNDVYFVSPSANANLGGIAATGADILRYTRSSNTWQMVYDGSDHGTLKNIAAFDVRTFNDGSWLLVFSANQVIPGLGTATPRDIVRFMPDDHDIFPLGPGTYSWYLRGAAIGLTAAAENIDALHATWDGHIYISTTGAAAVGFGNSIKAQDEDVLDCVLVSNGCDWQPTLFIDGSTIPGMAVEDIGGLAYGEFTNRYYVTINGAFNVGGVAGNSKSILRLTPSGNGWTVSNVEWLAPGVTFPSNLDGLSMVPYP